MAKYAKKKRSKTPLLLAIILILIALIVVMLYLMPETQAEPEVPKETAAATQSAQMEAENEDPITENEAPAQQETEAPAQQETEAPAQQEAEATEAVENVEAVELQLPIAVHEGLQINDISKYAGIYMEDGTDDVVSDLLMIELENTSEEDLHLAQITLTYPNATAQFQVTNLPAHRKVILLEQNRMAYVEAMPISAEAKNVAYVEKFSMYEDKVQISTMDGVINVRNVSGEDITDDIYVYYKNTFGDLYYGGITYRVRIEGGLKKDEIRQLMASHFDADTCQLLMVTIGG